MFRKRKQAGNVLAAIHAQATELDRQFREFSVAMADARKIGAALLEIQQHADAMIQSLTEAHERLRRIRDEVLATVREIGGPHA